MENKILTVHIGYPKTATTTLQKYLFAVNGNIFYTGKYPPSYNPRNQMLSHFTKMLYAQTASDFKKHADDVPLLNALQNSRYTQGLLSEEAIIDKCFTPAGKNTVIQNLNDLLGKISALRENSRIKIRILITVRRQEELIPSFYAQKYEQFKHAGYPDLTRYIDVLTGARGEGIGAHMFDFSHFFMCLKNIVPAGDIGIVSIHALKAREKKALETLSDFAHCSAADITAALENRENRRLKSHNTWISRNTRMLSVFARIGRAMPITEANRRRARQAIESRLNLTAGREIMLADSDCERIQKRYKASNDHLEAALQQRLF